jgi:DNA-binding LacI/PurR family transcriptional regulator
MPPADASITQIAEEAEVSVMTVSRVLNGFQPVRAKAKARAKRIREVAARLGYRKHSAPMAMRKGRFDTIAIMGSNSVERNYLPWQRESGIQDATYEHGLKLMVAREPDETFTDEAYVPSILGERMADGLLIDYTNSVPARMPELLKTYRIPAIWMNSKFDSDCIYFADEQAAAEATRHLLEAGHRRIAYWGASPSAGCIKHYSMSARARGYESAMQKAGLVPRYFNAELDDTRKLPEAVAGALASDERPTAILTYMQYQSMTLIGELPFLGLKPAEDVSLLTFCNDREISRSLQLTAMITPEYEMGRRAMELLVKKIAAPSGALAPVGLSLKLDVCRSTVRNAN